MTHSFPSRRSSDLAAGRGELPEDRLLVGLRLRRPGGRPAVARLGHRCAGRGIVLRLPAFGRYLDGDHGRRAGGIDPGDPGPDRDCGGRFGDPDREAGKGRALMEETLAIFISSTLRLAMPLDRKSVV